MDINVICAWPGHVSLETTNRYAEIYTRMKEAALRRCELLLDTDKRYRKTQICRDDASVIEWLEAL